MNTLKEMGERLVARRSIPHDLEFGYPRNMGQGTQGDLLTPRRTLIPVKISFPGEND